MSSTSSSSSSSSSGENSTNIQYIIDHMNEDHSDSLLAYSRYYGKIPDAVSAKLLSVDLKSMTIDVTTSSNQHRTITIPFLEVLPSPSQYRSMMVRMAKEASQALGMKIHTDEDKKSTRSGNVSSSGAGTPSSNKEYFQLANIPVSAAIFVAFYLCYRAAFTDAMPLYPQLEWVRDLGLTMFRSREGIQAVFVIGWLLHVLEAIAAYGECQKKGIEGRWRRIAWFIQTLAVGFPSLKLLQALPTPPSSTKQNKQSASNKTNKNKRR